MTEPSNEDRLRALLDEYGHVVRRAIQRYAGRGSGLDLDDIEQEVRLRVWRALEQRRHLVQPASYLYRVAVTASLDAWRRLRARREEPLPAPGSEAPGPGGSAPSPSPERLAESRQRLEQVQAALAQLAANRRSAVALHLQGFTTTEIGELRGWSEAKARNLVYRGLGELKALLEGERVELV